MALTIHVDLLVAAHTAVKTAIDAAGGTAAVKVYTAGRALLLVTLPLQSPCGTVNGTTGQLTFSPGTDGEAVAGGIAAIADVCDSNGKICLSCPCSSGTSPIADTFVLSSTSIVSGTTVSLLSATLG